LANPKQQDAELEAACRQAQLHDFIQGLPLKYDTLIGKMACCSAVASVKRWR